MNLAQLLKIVLSLQKFWCLKWDLPSSSLSGFAWLAALLGWNLAIAAADWPRLGGPDGLGISPETNLAHAWPATGPRALWTNAVGEGFAGPAIFQGQGYLLDRLTNGQDALRCFDLQDGRELWREAYDAPGRLPYDGSRNVPSVDAQRIYTVGPFGHARAYDRATHRLLWAHHLVDDFKDPQIDQGPTPEERADKLRRTQLPQWGMTQAPLLYQDLVILAPQTEKTGLVAYDQKDGRIRWRTGYLGRNWYSHVSPCLARFGGVDQVIMLAQPSDPEKSPAEAPPALISAFDAATGALLWTNATPSPYKIPISQPQPIDDHRLLIAGGYGLGCVMYEVTRTDGQWTSKVAFQTRNAAPHIHAPIRVDDRLYVMSFKEHGSPNTGLACLNLAGETLWRSGPALQFDSGALLVAGRLAYVMHGKSGVLHLFDITKPEAELLAKAKVLEAENGNVWAPMALSDGKLLVRDQHELRCLDVRNP